MFDRITDEAKRSLNLARETAQQFGQPHIAPEHVLHGVLSMGPGGAWVILAANGVNGADMLKDLALRMPPPGKVETKHVQLPFTDETKRVLEHAMDAAREARHSWIGTEHLLVALSMCTDDLVAETFRSFALTSSLLMQALRVPGATPEDPLEGLYVAGDSRREQLRKILEAAAHLAKQLDEIETARTLQDLISRLKP